MLDANFALPNPRYRPIDLLGRGGFGAVYLAEDLFMQKTVAVKILHAGSIDAGVRFRREPRLLQTQVNNRHVVTVLDADLDVHPPYIVGSSDKSVGRTGVGEEKRMASGDVDALRRRRQAVAPWSLGSRLSAALRPAARAPTAALTRAARGA